MEQLQLARQPLSEVLVLHVQREDGAEAVRHLLLQPAERLPLGAHLQARVLELGDRVAHHARARPLARLLGGEPLHQALGVGALPAHAQLEGADAADAEPALEAAHDGAEEEALGAQARHPLGGAAGRDGEHAAEHVAVAAEVLGAAVHDDVDAEGEGVEQRRRGEGGVDGEHGARAPGLGGVEGEVARLARGVQRRLHVDEVPRPQLRVRAVEGERGEPRELGDDLDHAVAAVVAVADGDAPGVQEHEHGVEGRQARAVGERWPFQDRG